MKIFLICTLLSLLSLNASATAVTETPWAPRAAAYRLTLFLGNLSPVPWQKISASWEAPIAGSALSVSAISRLTAEQAVAINSALRTKNRQALYEAATTVIANGILAHLEKARSSLGQSQAPLELAKAEALYRVFSDGIKAGDQQAAIMLGKAWLEMNSHLGSAGVLGRGTVEANKSGFVAAQTVVANYLKANYLPDEFFHRNTLSSVPENIVRSGVEVQFPTILPPGSNIADQTELPRLVLQFEEAGTDEAELPLVAYGDMLFDSPQIFGKPARDLGITCSTCHNRSDVNREFLIPGLSTRPGGMDVDGSFFNPLFNDRVDDHLDTPSLRGIRFTAPYGRDGREPSLRQFVRNVIVTEFAGDEPTPFQLDALVAYMRQFDWLPNPKIDRKGRLTKNASAAALRGELLFNKRFPGLGNRSCSSCHTPGRNFRDGLTHDIGTATPPFEGGTPTAFDTPTLRNINFTAPYMHDGSLPSLNSVVDWFNEKNELDLDEEQKADLVSYLKAVGDGEKPYQRFKGRNSAFRLSFEELTTFASTLNTLIPARDQENIALLIKTVAPDLAADASIMTNQSGKSEVYQLAEILRDVGVSSAAGNWMEAAQHWDAFKAKQVEIDEKMF